MWDQIGPWLTPGGLLAFTVLSLIRGWLIPSRTHAEIVRHLENTITLQRATIAERDAQISVLLGRPRGDAS